MRSGGKGFEEAEAVEAGHLDVEEEQVGRVRFEISEAFFGVFELAGDVEAGRVGEHAANALAGEAFVIDDYCAYVGHGSGRMGMRMVTSKPPSAAWRKSMWCSPP